MPVSFVDLFLFFGMSPSAIPYTERPKGISRAKHISHTRVYIANFVEIYIALS